MPLRENKIQSQKIESNEWQIKLDQKLERNEQNATKNVNKTIFSGKVKSGKSRAKKLEKGIQKEISER